jgi:formylglycine-generating enzyme required for sulfatase activity
VGGSWRSVARDLRSAFRYSHDPGHRDQGLGLRLIRVCTQGAQ